MRDAVAGTSPHSRGLHAWTSREAACAINYDALTPDERDREQERLLREYLARSLSEREVRRAAVRERERFPLEHRGAWRVPDTGEQPLVPAATPTTERLGDWGYRVIASPPASPLPPAVHTAGCYRIMRMVWTRGHCEPTCLFRAHARAEVDRFLARRAAAGRPAHRVWIDRASHPATRRRQRRVA